MNQSKIKRLLTLSNSSISVFAQTLSQFPCLQTLSQFYKVNMLSHSERCAGSGERKMVLVITTMHTTHKTMRMHTHTNMCKWSPQGWSPNFMIQSDLIL